MNRLAFRDERGTIVLLSAFAILALIATAAVVVDLAVARNDRSDGQIGVDAAAAAAGIDLGAHDPYTACVSAFDYLSTNLDGTFATTGCAGFPAACTEYTVAVEATATVGDVTASVVYPVVDAHRFMQASAAGAPYMPLSSADGEACERIGVGVERARTHFFGGFIGAQGSSTSVHAVARSSQTSSTGRPIHLLLLNETECGVIIENGSGSSGGLYVRSTTDPLTGEVFPGFIASDSNGTSGCSRDGVIDVNGSGATIQADGAPGCDGELVADTGEGCGTIEVYAATGEGCNLPACSSTGNVNPPPTELPRRITRAPIDHRYNCKTSYDHDIAGCADTALSEPWIDQLVDELGGVAWPVGYQDYVAEGHPCRVKGGNSPTVVIPEGNWWITCSDLNVKGTLIFEGGNIVLAGDLTVTAGGRLEANTANTGLYDWSPGQSFDPYESSADAAVLVLQSGIFSKAGGSEVHLENMTVYLGENAELQFTGGDGEMIWTAPEEGPFEDLAFWSESAEQHKFAGEATLEMTGVFFAPHAQVVFRGNGSLQTAKAQFISDKLELSGNGGLELTPELDRMILFASDSTSGLIR